MNVPFLDLKASYLELKDELDAAFQRVMNSGWYILGNEVAAFEREWANYCGTEHCVGVGNGLEALHLSLLAMGVGPGDEVIVPANTYIATWLAVSFLGAKPVPVEPCEKTYNIDPQKIEAAITKKTKVILPVHLYGQPADMDPIMDLAGRYGLMVLEDSAQAHGAIYKGRYCGALGTASAWSFYPGKNLGAFGDAGAVTTNNAQIADKVRVLRNYGSRVKYVNELKGFNSRLDELHAALLRVKLTKLNEWNNRRKKIAEFYLKNLSDLPDVTLPFVPDWADPVWHVFVIRVKERERLQKFLDEHGIKTLIHYPIPPHLQAAYMDDFKGVSFPITESIHREVISLPMGPALTLQMAEFVVDTIRKYFKAHSS